MNGLDIVRNLHCHDVRMAQARDQWVSRIRQQFGANATPVQVASVMPIEDTWPAWAVCEGFYGLLSQQADARALLTLAATQARTAQGNLPACFDVTAALRLVDAYLAGQSLRTSVVASAAVAIDQAARGLDRMEAKSAWFAAKALSALLTGVLHAVANDDLLYGSWWFRTALALTMEASDSRIATFTAVITDLSRALDDTSTPKAS